MNGDPRITTNEWNKIARTLEKTGVFSREQLNPDEATQILCELVTPHSVVIGHATRFGKATPIGSGTLVKNTNEQFGIVTAGHVVGTIKHKENIWIIPKQYGEQVSWINIGGHGMRGFGENNRGLAGPDIGWIPLSAEEAERIESLAAIIYNRQISRKAISGDSYHVYAIFGFVDATSSLHDNYVTAHGMLTRQSSSTPPNEDGWDYAEYAITYEEDWIPKSHGGVSGSGVWRIDLSMDGTGETAAILQGVVYAEGTSENRKFIAHGEQSLRIVLHEA